MIAEVLTFCPMTDMPNRLRELRKVRRLTLEFVALELGTAITQISALERGLRPLTPQWMRRFADVFDVKPGELLSREDNPTILTEAEADFLDRYRGASEDQRRTITGLMDVVIPYTPQPAFEQERDKN